MRMLLAKIVSPEEYDKIEIRNEKKINAISKRHPKDEAQIRLCIKTCLDLYLLTDDKCNKHPLSKTTGHFHLRKTIVPYVIEYGICTCTDKRYKPLVEILKLDTTEKCEKDYKSRTKGQKK